MQTRFKQQKTISKISFSWKKYSNNNIYTFVERQKQYAFKLPK